MPFIPATIQKLCSPTERALYNSSKPTNIKAMTRTELRKAVERARDLRDKNRDLFRRQSLALRKQGGAKGGKAGIANLRTQQKAAIFAEALTRFEKQLKALDTKAAKVTATKKAPVKKASAKPAATKKPTTAKSKARATTKASVKRTAKTAARSKTKKVEKKTAAKASPTAKAKAGFTASSAKSKSRKTMLQSTRSKPIQGHIKSSGKRAQAKRDSR